MKNRNWKTILTVGIASACLCVLMAAPAFAGTATDAHGNEVELDVSLHAVSDVTLYGADDAAWKEETNLGDFWTDALLWFAASGRINDYFEEDDAAAGITQINVDAEHIVAIWNGGNLKADIPEGEFGAELIMEVLPYPNQVAVVYMTGEQLLEVLEAASQGLPYSEETKDACASFMQAAGLEYSVDLGKAYDAGEPYGDHWFRAASLGRVAVDSVNGKDLVPEDLYAVITSNANFNGMDSSYLIQEAAQENTDSTITTAVVRDVIWMYINEELGGEIPDTYQEAQGRITLN